ncbi:hypothetical protein DWQ65_03510 [Treponema phagedenis]|uniref:hypothetical protein n=1 Tax=Treponema phagedenis TaxID=162 RepID=UPI0005CBCDD8|nr:hypothetical protein [Treponema phagedenis]QSH99153.1 hypothetical protein DWQ65_03510 [Treponema phagedenis]
MECNGLPFSPDVFPDFTEYVKTTFHLGVDTHTGWPFRPLIERTDGTKVFIKAVTDSGKNIY